MKRFIIISVVAVLLSCGSSQASREWFTNPANGHKYALTLNHSNWTDAEAEAMSVGGHLVTINDEAEKDWLLDPALPFGNSYAPGHPGHVAWNAVWIGMEYVGGDKTLPTSWEWVSGEPVTYWNPAPIPHAFPFQDGIHMTFNGTYHPYAGTFSNNPAHDISLDDYLRGVIEVVPDPITDTRTILYCCAGKQIYRTDLSDPCHPTELLGDYVGMVDTRLEGLAYDPFEECLYVVGHDSLNVYRIDTDTADLSVACVSECGGLSLAFNTNTGLLYAARGSYNMYSINPQTGETIRVGSIAGGGMAYDSNRDVFYASHDSTDIVTVAPDGTPLSSRRFMGHGFEFDGLAYDPINDVIYAGNCGHVVAVNPNDWSYEELIGPPVKLLGGFAVVVSQLAPPLADAGGPYTIYVDDMLTLDGSGSTDDDNDIVSYMWDLDDNGTFETDANDQAIFDVNYTYLQSLGLLIDHTYNIHLQVTDSEGQSDTNDTTLTILPKPALEVAVDIKPGSCPNPLNVKSSGVLPVAILGSEELDVNTIDATSIELAGVGVVRHSFEDVATPVPDSNDCNCTTAGPDGFTDLTLKFKTQEIVEAIGEVNHGDVLILELTGVLFGERPIEGADCIVIRGKHKPLNQADINKDGKVDLIDFAIFSENWLESSIVD